MSDKRCIIIKTEGWHDANVESFRCGWCQETFSFAAILINFCPNCGTEYESEESEVEQ